MSTTYTYSRETFPGGINPQGLAYAITSNPSITSTLTSVTTDANNVLITFTTALTTASQTALNSTISSYNPSTVFPAASGNYQKFRELQSSGTNGHAGATFSAGSWVTRILNNTDTSPGQYATLNTSTNTVTLPAGTYLIYAGAPAYGVDGHKLRLFNVTTSTVMLVGTSARAPNILGLLTAVTVQERSYISGVITITAATEVIRLEHRCTTSRTNDGFGLATGFATSEVYTELEITRI